MPKSKNRKNHNTKLNKYKNQKNMSEQQYEIPEVRNIPIWANDAVIPITGVEFEAIFNNLMSLQTAQQAVNGIMSRSILDGIIQMDFERYDKEKKDYVPMSEEAKAPYKADFAKAVAAAKAPKPQEGLIEKEPLIVNPLTGKEMKSDTLPKQEAKVVKGDFGVKESLTDEKPKATRKKKEVATTNDVPTTNG